ncbi:heat shock 70 kDa protein 12A-like [Salminus brasiliensis]|uniref:heat shock 70 kDa protein 12A-like n=1 Tax=Salminus brasiliensis TaxID=930266 RepID=UPI003B82DE2F
MEDSMLCIAIDFGTSFSGYCFQVVGGEQIRQPRWGLEYGYETLKTPTSILFDEDGNVLHFGYDAVLKYTNLTKRKEAMKLYFFDNFKMELYGKELNRDLKITSRNGKQMRAMKVFSESLRYMKDHALNMIRAHLHGLEFYASDAKWVVTVPAIWSPSAKQFMREAAVEAGLVTEFESAKLIIALEPEAASVWCKQLPREGFIVEDLEKNEKIEDVPGTQYMVVDCGGGTIDITVHEVVKGDLLKELHKVSGNNMGGQTVDRNFRMFLREIFSVNTFEEFEKNHPAELQKLMDDFMLCKRGKDDVAVRCPFSLIELARKEKNIEDYFTGTSDATWESGSIILSKEQMSSFHQDSLRAIESLISEILKKSDLEISYLFLVGGFALSPYVRNCIREKFGTRCTVLCPIDAQGVIMKGAAKFGAMPSIVESRISLYTYGIATFIRLGENESEGKSMFVNRDGEKFCGGFFDSLVKKDESVSVDEVRQCTFRPVDRDQTEMRFSFYCTESTSAEFVDEEGMMNIGSFSVPVPKCSTYRNRSVRLEVKFGYTEMQARAIDVHSGRSHSVKLDFMSHHLISVTNH